MYRSIRLDSSVARIRHVTHTIASTYGVFCREITIGFTFDNSRDLKEYGTEEEMKLRENDIYNGFEERDVTSVETKRRIAAARDTALSDALAHMRGVKVVQINLPTTLRGEERDVGTSSFHKTLRALSQMPDLEEIRIASKRTQYIDNVDDNAFITLFGDVRGLPSLLRSASTTLRRLSLLEIGDVDDIATREFFHTIASDLPQLQDVTLSAFTPLKFLAEVPPSSLACTNNLTSLTLDWCPDVTPGFLLKTLRKLPNLEDLTVSFFQSTPGTDKTTEEDEEVVRNIPPPNPLETLSLRGAPARYLSTVSIIPVTQLHMLYPEKADCLAKILRKPGTFEGLSYLHVRVGPGDRFSLDLKEGSDLIRACAERGVRLFCDW